MKTAERVPRVLFADDHEDTLAMMEAAARIRGWEFETARTAEEIVEKVRAQCHEEGRCFDALVLDISYEGSKISGVQAVRAIRKGWPNIPVIFVTGYDSRLTKQEALGVGQEFITKPFNLDYVFNRIQTWINWARVTRKHEYEGPDRRKAGINRSGYYRRVTDAPIEINARVASAAHTARGHQR